MAARDEPDLDLEVHPWGRQTRASCGVDEPRRLHALFVCYCETRPRSLRVALARSRKLSGSAADAVRASGALQRAVQFWRWRERADALAAHRAAVEKAAFDAAKLAARRRRLAQLDRLNDALGLRLEEIAERATLEGLLRLHTQEREEYAMPAEDEHDTVGLPTIESRLPKPPDPPEE